MVDGTILCRLLWLFCHWNVVFDDGHAFHDGRLEEVVLRHLDAEDGQTVIAKDIRLSDFLENMHI
uniref:Uncharacterized protein n=1 Tax=Brassica campestris TaxID=3711 RepID=A0A3P6CGW2_BRACM|nr:unnamed protein product [Brassica rapa]